MALDELSLGTNRQYRPGPRGPLRALSYPFRFLFRLLKRTLAGILRLIAYHPVSSLLVVLLLAAVGFLSYRDFGTVAPAGNESGTGIAPSPAAENFIKGQTTFDANLMWQNFSDDFKQRLTQRGTNEQAIQQQLDQRKRAGGRVEDVKYAGGVVTADGSKVYLYVLTMDVPGSQGPVESHYVLTVDPSDKITNVE